MKSFVKALLLYDTWAPLWQRSSLSKFHKALMARIATMWFGHPSGDFFVIGVTGTNGKTTTVNVLHDLLQAHVGKTFSVSTAKIRIGDQSALNATKMSSLDPFSLQKIFRQAKNEGCQVAVIEVTSHGLDQHRFEGIDFDMAILTNITNDHLEYHGGWDAYVAAKKKLFVQTASNHKGKTYAVFPKDDTIGRQWYDELLFDEKISYGIAAQASLTGRDIQESVDGTTAQIAYMQESYSLQTTLRGSYNINNILAALSALTILGVPLESSVQTVTSIDGVSGRMDTYEHNGVYYFVDYAHTEDALDKTLKYLHSIKGDGRLLVLSGAMGDGRDRAKRPKMGSLLDQYADIVVLADEDPGSENRFGIIGDIVKGITQKKLGHGLFVLPQRRDAVQFLVEEAKSGDLVFLAGKGHEEIMLTQFGREPWSDREVLEALLGGH